MESVAFVVLDALGLDAGNYSFAYVARWSGGPVDVVRDTAERVIECAGRILRAVDDEAPAGATAAR